MLEIHRMSLIKLQRVEDFTITSKISGTSIRWEKPTNIVKLNISKYVELHEQSVTVYNS